MSTQGAPSRNQLDNYLAQAKKSLRTATREEAVKLCQERKLWMETNWPPAVAKAATGVLREAFKARFKGAQ